MCKIILVLTNFFDPTSDLVIKRIDERGLGKVVRFHPEEIVNNNNVYVRNKDDCVRIITSKLSFSAKDVGSVWYRRPSFPKIKSKEEEVSRYEELEFRALVEGLYGTLDNARWYSDDYSMQRASNKLHQIRVASRLGFNVPQTIICHNDLEVIKNINPIDYIVKPLNPSNCVAKNSDFQACLNTIAFSKELLDWYVNLEQKFPIFLQKKIIKNKELRVTVIGKDIVAVAIDTKNAEAIDTRASWENSEHYLTDISDDLKDKILSFQKYFNLNYGAFDFIVDNDNVCWFLECNPAGQFAWIDFKVEEAGLIDLMAEHLALKREALV